MFSDFNLLTGQQGEVIDQIESNVKSAVDYVEDANQDVYQAIKHSKKKQWYVCCLNFFPFSISIFVSIVLRVITFSSIIFCTFFILDSTVIIIVIVVAIVLLFTL